MTFTLTRWTMEFDLYITFSGLCTQVFHPTRHEVAVLMPDARDETPEGPGPGGTKHEDETSGVSHAGYLRFNVANALPEGVEVPYGAGDDGEQDGPRVEGIHRLSRQTLDIRLGMRGGTALPGAPDPTPAERRHQYDNVVLPDVDRFTKDVLLVDGLFEKVPPKALLFRTLLRGGAFAPKRGMPRWEIPNALGGETGYGDTFTGSVTWKNTYQGDGITLAFTPFGRGEAVTIPLRPVMKAGRPTIELKFANLCAHDPLEWKEYKDRDSLNVDKDFKWLYRLLKPKTGTFGGKLGKGQEFPVPHVASGPRGREDCIGEKMMRDFPERDAWDA